MGNCHKGKTSRCQRTVNILSHEWYFQRNNTLCCFPLVLKISKPNSNDETYYGNQASTVKSHLSLWPNVTARVVLIFCHQVCWKRLMQPHPHKQRSVYLETAKWLAESPACLYLSDVDPGWCVGIVTEPVVQSIFIVQTVHYDKRAVNSQHPKLIPEGQHTESVSILEERIVLILRCLEHGAVHNEEPPSAHVCYRFLTNMVVPIYSSSSSTVVADSLPQHPWCSLSLFLKFSIANIRLWASGIQ